MGKAGGGSGFPTMRQIRWKSVNLHRRSNISSPPDSFIVVRSGATCLPMVNRLGGERSGDQVRFAPLLYAQALSRSLMRSQVRNPKGFRARHAAAGNIPPRAGGEAV